MRINLKKNWFLKILLYHFWGLILARGRQTKKQKLFRDNFPDEIGFGDGFFLVVSRSGWDWNTGCCCYTFL